MVYIMQYFILHTRKAAIELREQINADIKKAYEQLFVLECINRIRLTCDKGLHCLPCMKQS